MTLPKVSETFQNFLKQYENDLSLKKKKEKTLTFNFQRCLHAISYNVRKTNTYPHMN